MANTTAAEQEKKDAKKEEKQSVVLDTLSTITDNLETYQGRDTVITLMHYLALIAADMCTYYRWGI
jgi:hypothetical protein